MSSPKPSWLGVKLPSGDEYHSLVRLLREKRLHTVCQEANCPNIGDCFSRKTATFLILGDVCTRNCKYCNVKHGVPGEVDWDEPSRIARAVGDLGLHYIVITSVTRDDLEDGGATIFAKTVREVRKRNPDCKVEVLIPDFRGEALRQVIDARPHTINHNIEVVRRLFPIARPQGDYERSLDVIKNIHESGIISKSGFMVGLGENRLDIIRTMDDLCSVTDILTIGQYLQPTRDHMDVMDYYSPEEFDELKELAYEKGFKHVESGPLVRSSYHAAEYGI